MQRLCPGTASGVRSLPNSHCQRTGLRARSSVTSQPVHGVDDVSLDDLLGLLPDVRLPPEEDNHTRRKAGRRKGSGRIVPETGLIAPSPSPALVRETLPPWHRAQQAPEPPEPQTVAANKPRRRRKPSQAAGGTGRISTGAQGNPEPEPGLWRPMEGYHKPRRKREPLSSSAAQLPADSSEAVNLPSTLDWGGPELSSTFAAQPSAPQSTAHINSTYEHPGYGPSSTTLGSLAATVEAFTPFRNSNVEPGPSPTLLDKHDPATTAAPAFLEFPSPPPVPTVTPSLSRPAGGFHANDGDFPRPSISTSLPSPSAIASALHSGIFPPSAPDAPPDATVDTASTSGIVRSTRRHRKVVSSPFADAVDHALTPAAAGQSSTPARRAQDIRNRRSDRFRPEPGVAVFQLWPPPLKAAEAPMEDHLRPVKPTPKAFDGGQLPAELEGCDADMGMVPIPPLPRGCRMRPELQEYIKAHLAGIYDPAWHSTLYEFLFDLWPEMAKAIKRRNGALVDNILGFVKRVLGGSPRECNVLCLTLVHALERYDVLLDRVIDRLPRRYVQEVVLAAAEALAPEVADMLRSMGFKELKLLGDEGEDVLQFISRLKRLSFVHPSTPLDMLCYIEDWDI